MYPIPPSTRVHWVYDDPSGVPEPQPYARRWAPRERTRAPRVSFIPAVRRVRILHREG